MLQALLAANICQMQLPTTHASKCAVLLVLQALSIRPDILSPAAMNELQKLCDKVPSFDSAVAMQVRVLCVSSVRIPFGMFACSAAHKL
jgi:hypothetical protein